MNELRSKQVFFVHGLTMAGDVLLRRLRQLGKKRWGKRFQQFRRDAPTGNPRDPLIGFPFVFYRNPKLAYLNLTADNWFMNLKLQKVAKAFLLPYRS
jgi:hypothetical protein